MGVDPKENRE